MNQSNASKSIFLVNPKCRAIMCNYDPEVVSKPNGVAMFKTFDPLIAVGDMVIVTSNTRHGMTTAKVTEVDVNNRIDFNAQDVVGWIVQRVSRESHDKTVAAENHMIETIRAAEMKREQDRLRDALLAHAQDQIKCLPIASMGGAEDAAGPVSGEVRKKW